MLIRILCPLPPAILGRGLPCFLEPQASFLRFSESVGRDMAWLWDLSPWTALYLVPRGLGQSEFCTLCHLHVWTSQSQTHTTLRIESGRGEVVWMSNASFPSGLKVEVPGWLPVIGVCASDVFVFPCMRRALRKVVETHIMNKQCLDLIFFLYHSSLISISFSTTSFIVFFRH